MMHLKCFAQSDTQPDPVERGVVLSYPIRETARLLGVAGNPTCACVSLKSRGQRSAEELLLSEPHFQYNASFSTLPHASHDRITSLLLSRGGTFCLMNWPCCDAKGCGSSHWSQRGRGIAGWQGK